MSRFISTTAAALVKWTGYNKNKLPSEWKDAVDTFAAPGGSAESKLGTLKSVHINSRNGNPVHQSHFNPEDKEFVISAVVSGKFGRKTCHVYADGTGTTKLGDERS